MAFQVCVVLALVAIAVGVYSVALVLKAILKVLNKVVL